MSFFIFFVSYKIWTEKIEQFLVVCPATGQRPAYLFSNVILGMEEQECKQVHSYVPMTTTALLANPSGINY